MRWTVILAAFLLPACAGNGHVHPSAEVAALDKHRMDTAEQEFAWRRTAMEQAVDTHALSLQEVLEAQVYLNRCLVAIHDMRQAYDDRDQVKFEWALGLLHLNNERMRGLVYEGNHDDQG